MERIAVVSSNLCAVGYDPDIRVLEIEFGKDYPAGHKTNRVYQYLNVPQEVHQGLLESDSHGRFVHYRLIDKFDFRYLGTVEEMEA